MFGGSDVLIRSLPLEYAISDGDGLRANVNLKQWRIREIQFGLTALTKGDVSHLHWLQ